MTLLSIARIEPGKGVDLLIEAVPLLPENIQVNIAGDGALLPGLRRRVKELGIANRVVFYGWVTGESKEALLREADIFCLPSSYDSFGMVFVEAMVHGLPVVALDWGPIKDVVPNGVCGILISKQDPKLLAEAIGLLAMNNSLCEKLGRNGQHWVLEQFSAQRVGQKLQKLLGNCL